MPITPEQVTLRAFKFLLHVENAQPVTVSDIRTRFDAGHSNENFKPSKICETLERLEDMGYVREDNELSLQHARKRFNEQNIYKGFNESRTWRITQKGKQFLREQLADTARILK